MQRILFPFLMMVLANAASMCFADSEQKSEIKWLTQFEEAVKQSKASSKPILLFFTGTDWCTWCNRLEEEVLNTTEFADVVADKFIFVKLDFPFYKQQDPATTNQNKQLQKKYDVRSFPTVILLDSKQQKIGVTGYRAGGARQYASYLLRMLNDYHAYSSKLQKLDQQNLSGTELRQLLEKARELGAEEEALRIVKQGLVSDLKPYFQMERYRYLAEEGLIHEEEAAALKQQLLSADSRNERKIHFQIAVIEFEAYSEEMERENYAPEIAVAPLLNYIEKFGSQDKENAWRLQMIISQVYLDKNKIPNALKFAQSSYDSAPVNAQPQIATAIRNIRLQSSGQR